MSGLLQIRDVIRDFIRKYDEIITPVFKFIAALLMFITINSLFGYSELFERSIVTFLLAVICALVSAPLVVLIGSLVVIFNSFFVSKEIGVIAVLLFIVIYFLYIRMFPDCSYVLFLVPFLCMIKMTYAIPVIVAIFAGAAGVVPTVFGLIIYKFAIAVKDINSMLLDTKGEDDLDVYQYLIDNVLKNKELIMLAVVFAVVILITYFIHKLSFDYSWYVAIGIGGLCNILFCMISGIMIDIEVNLGWLMIGSIVGVLISMVVRLCKSAADYAKKEVVQFEDDDYYYYVKAIPKYNVSVKKKTVKKMTSTNRTKK